MARKPVAQPQVFGKGAVQADATTIRIEQERIAQWMRDYAGPSYGPGGSHKLLDDAVYDEQTILRSAASGMREMRLEHAAVEPYRQLADNVQAAVGDGGTTALLLATHLVLESYRAQEQGAAWPSILDGLDLARRQTLATMRQLKQDAAPEDALEATGPSGWANCIVKHLRQHPEIQLDAVDIRHADVAAPAWAEGVRIDPQETPRGDPVQANVLLVTEATRMKLRHDWASHVIRAPANMELAADSRDAHVVDLLRKVEELGVRLLACSEGIDDRLGFRLVSRGVVVQDEVSLELMRRLEAATGAKTVASIDVAETADLGRATVRCNKPKVGGWTVIGTGDAWTLNIPKAIGTLNSASSDEAERMLRAAGAVLENPGALPGGGRWQSRCRDALATASAAAPGHTSFGVSAASRAFEQLRAHLVRNSGQDPLRTTHLGTVRDPFACMMHAVSAAFETVAVMLHMDGRFEKKQSEPTMLRGLQEATHQARNNNDVPPWM